MQKLTDEQIKEGLELAKKESSSFISERRDFLLHACSNYEAASMELQQ
jgi:hypothetical protein